MDRQFTESAAHPPVVVDLESCDRLAALLARMDIPPDEEDSVAPAFPRNLTGNFFLALVAICHQTSPRALPPLEGVVSGKHLRGWDYLSAKLESAARDDLRLLEPERWSRLTADCVCRLFRDQEFGERLSEPTQRAELLRDLGQKMMARSWATADQIYSHCGGRIATGRPNLLQELSTFAAYSDPVRKKSLFFVALMRNSGTWEYQDEEKLGPPVDYHEVRGHLRVGTIRVTDPGLLEKLRAGAPVTAEEDIAIRQSTYDAIMHISMRSRLNNPSQLHYLFWNVFRSICTRELPQCFDLRPHCTLPERYMHLTSQPNGLRRCPLSAVCSSAGDTLPITEHVFATDYY